MTLTLIDWLVIGGYFALNLAIGLYYARRARGSTTEFFLSGRSVPWWLAGTSMVATTFAADTPHSSRKIGAARHRAATTPGRTIITRADNDGAQVLTGH